MDGDVFAKEVVRLWRAWKTVHEMVVDRVRQPLLSAHLFVPREPLDLPSRTQHLTAI